ncbi:ABC transporter permease [Glaciibacter superstes]|uniref:ABC transporter permease n=1 Tax=Glaciibacter superstes TaxID=501023 RepID=UPI0003B6B2AB|nr:ABC transporter permease [Glaciibacter superstes]
MSSPTFLLVGFQARRRAKARSRSLKPWYRNTPLVAGMIVVGLLILLAIFAPLIAPYDPIAQDLGATLQGPSAAHWLGTDKFGRDVLSRLIWGAQVDLRVGFLAVLIPFVFGSILGAFAGYFGGWFDAIVMRIVDVFFAFPFLVMVIVLVFILGSGETSIYLAIAAVSWVSYVKIVRGEVISAKEQDYVVGARLGGMSNARVLFRHIGPNVFSQAIIYAMSDIVMNIMGIVTLGYLGLGIAPPTAEWGSMILEGQEFITTHWLQATVPGLMVVITSLGVSWLGDGLSDLLSPERRK